MDALHDSPEIDLVVCRQEGGVSYAAEADGKLTGRPGVAFVTRGPGATNATIGVHVALQDSTPMILLIGDVARGDKDREGFQEVDFTAMFAPLAKWAARIDDAARIPEYIARAYAVAISGRPGPVVLALPEDMLRDEVEAVDRPRSERPLQVPARSRSPRSATSCRAAKNPIAIVGGADWSAEHGAAFARFAEAWGLPVAVGFRRQDAIANTCPVYAGNLGYGPNPKLDPARARRRSAARRRRAARRGDHRRLHPGHARPSRPDPDPHPPRSQRARPRLPRPIWRSAPT